MEQSRVSAINIAPGARLPMRSVTSVEAEAGKGLVGDRYHGTKHRHVTVQSQQALDLAAAELGRPIEPAGTRRNVTVDLGAMAALRRRAGSVCRVLESGTIAVGDRVVLESRSADRARSGPDQRGSRMTTGISRSVQDW